MSNKRVRLQLAFVLAFVWVFACGNYPTSLAKEKRSAPLSVGFITVGPVSDWGYNYAHDQGRRFLEKTLGKQVVTTIVEKIPETAEVERVMEKMIARGTRLIFSTSYGYFEPALRVAARHPNVIIEQCGRVVPPAVKNVATYFGKQYEPMYVAGVVAGRMTKKNKLGFVAAHPVPQVLQNINAFTLGARSVNPKARVTVVWTNNWSDPATEAEAAKGLIGAGADVLSMHVDSPLTVVQTAEKAGVMTVGYHADLRQFAPKGWLTGEQWNWGPLYEQIARSVRDGRWRSGNYRYGLKDGYTNLSSFGTCVPSKVETEALAVSSKIKNGDLVVFQGPLKDRSGKKLLAFGGKPDSKLIENMNWFVEGVDGSLPKR